MCATFSKGDVGKRVEDADGRTIGTVTSVDGDRARVETKAGLLDSIKAVLGWGLGDDAVSIVADDVGETTDDAVRLAGDVEAGGEGGAKRHADNEDAPPEGDRTVTRERGEEQDR